MTENNWLTISGVILDTSYTFSHLIPPAQEALKEYSLNMRVGNVKWPTQSPEGDNYGIWTLNLGLTYSTASPDSRSAQC